LRVRETGRGLGSRYSRSETSRLMYDAIVVGAPNVPDEELGEAAKRVAAGM